jgi:hypothetical protein
MNRFALTILFVAVAACRTATLFAQQPPVTPAPAAQPAAQQQVVMLAQQGIDADSVRDQLQELMRQYPPQVGEVLRRDPSLLSRPDYIAPYPMLVAFLQQHPEIVRNPSYFFGGYDYYQNKQTPEQRSLEALGVLLGGTAGFMAFTIVIGVLAWIAKAVIQHRRWIRLSRVQTDVHTKLMDRMQTNEELLAYIQSPAGRRFLESTPPSEPDAPRWAAPVGPIIFSMMAGIVLATVGIGFIYSAWGITDEAKQAFIVAGVVVFSLGTGFILAALMAYVVSARLGLFPAPAPKSSTSLDNA